MNIISHLTNDAHPCQRNPQCSQGHDCDCDDTEEGRRAMEMLAPLVGVVICAIALGVWAVFTFLKG